jgi:hypothetical protein
MLWRPRVARLLPQVDGETHVLHTEEAPQGTRLVMDTLSCLIAKEADPSRVMAQVRAVWASQAAALLGG